MIYHFNCGKCISQDREKWEIVWSYYYSPHSEIYPDDDISDHSLECPFCEEIIYWSCEYAAETVKEDIPEEDESSAWKRVACL